MPGVKDAVAAALTERAAEMKQQREANETAAKAKAKTRLGQLFGSRLNTNTLTLTYVEGSVVATDGEVALAVDPEQNVWLAVNDNGEWTRQGKPIQSLVDLAGPLGVT